MLDLSDVNEKASVEVLRQQLTLLYKRISDDPFEGGDAKILSVAQTYWDKLERLNKLLDTKYGTNLDSLPAGVVPEPEPLRVLDVACGVGEPAISLALAAGGESRVVGVDIAEGMVKAATRYSQQVAPGRVHSQNSKVDVTFSEARAEALPFDDGEFDALSCRFGLMYMDDKAALGEFYRVLKTDGHAAIAVWGKEAQVGYLQLFREVVAEFYPQAGAARPAGPDVFRFGEENALMLSLVNAGFNVDEVKQETIKVRFLSPEALWAGLLSTPEGARACAGADNDQKARMLAWMHTWCQESSSASTSVCKTFKVLQKAIVGKAFLPGSDKERYLSVGEEIVALEVRSGTADKSESVTGKARDFTRVKFRDPQNPEIESWASIISTTGKRLLEKCATQNVVTLPSTALIVRATKPDPSAATEQTNKAFGSKVFTVVASTRMSKGQQPGTEVLRKLQPGEEVIALPGDANLVRISTGQVRVKFKDPQDPSVEGWASTIARSGLRLLEVKKDNAFAWETVSV